MSDKLILVLPSKGRLMEQCAAALARAGLSVAKSGSVRGYRGEIAGLPDVEVKFRLFLRNRALSAARYGAPRYHG
jgi:ATP phosphoribosyltransferase